MVKRCIEQNLRSLNFEAGDGRIASGILVKNQREQRRVHKGQGECWQWNANGQSSKGDKCSFPHDEDKRAKFAPPPAPSPEPSTPQDVRNLARAKSRGRSPSGRMSRLPCKDYLKGTCTNPSCEKVAFSRVSVPQDKRGMQIRGKVHVHTPAGWLQPSKKSNRNGDKSAVAFIEGYTTIGLRMSSCGAAETFVDFTEELRHTETDLMCSVHKSRRASCKHSRPIHPSLGIICPGDSHQRNPNAPKFENRSVQETDWQEAAWRLARNILKLKEETWIYLLLTYRKVVSLHPLKTKRRKETLSWTPARRCTW